MLNNIKEAIEFFYSGLMYICNIIMNFIPSPFSEIFGVFVVIILIIVLIKLINIIGGLVENLIGVFI